MSLRILVLTDSVALPRRVPEFTLSSDTWPELLKKDGHTIFQCSIGGATSTQLKAQCYYYNPDCFDVDYIIVQCGIVDCAPRFLHRTEIEFLKAIPRVGFKVIRTLNKKWVRSLRGITYTNPDIFKKNIQQIQKTFKGKPVFFVGIVPATPEYERTLQGVSENIIKYNQILEANSDMISVNGIEDFGLMSDFHHLNSAGHKFIFDLLSAKLKDSKSEKTGVF